MGNFFKNVLDGIVGAASGVINANPLTKNDPFAQGLLQGAQGLLGSASQSDANKQNERLLDKQMDFQREMFDKQLEANRRAIKDEYQQFRELGINPLAMNLTQTNMAGSSGSPAALPHQYTSPIERANINLINAQAKLADKQAEAIDPNEAPSRTALNRSSADWQDAQRKTEDLVRPYKRDLYQYQINSLIEDVYYKDKQIDYLDSQIQSNIENLKYLASDKFFEYLRTSTEVKKMNNETKALFASIACDWYKAQTDRFNAETSRMVGQSQVELNQATKKGIEYDNQLKSFDVYKKELCHQIGVDYDEVQASQKYFRMIGSQNEGEAMKIEFDNEMYKNSSKFFKTASWFYRTAGNFGGLAGQFLSTWMKTH